MADLTPSQQKALSLDRHLAVTANAGSGKTRVMVERYVRLFESRPDLSVQNVVAITFTENAGAELRKRILDRVNELIVEYPRDSAERARLARLRDTLSGAIIGTIHSFAARMLKAYPVEANVDASFGILQGADERLMREDVIERVFFSTLEEAYENNEHPQLLHLFQILGRFEVRNTVRTLMGKRALATMLQSELLLKSDDEIITSWRAELDQFLKYLPHVRPVLADIEGNLTKRKEAEDVRPLFAPYYAAKTPYEQAAALAPLAELLLSDSGLHSYRVNKKSLASDLENERDEFIQFCRDNESILKSLPPTEAEWKSEHRQYLSLMRAAIDLAERVVIEYESDKASYGVLDFDDLVLKFERLLRDERVREELSRQFQFIMIDEYQDTDSTQFALAELLTKDLTTSNLMVVGDPKQSIYGFRNADVSVFRETEQSIDSQGHISLAESFRMAPIPLAAINRVFKPIMVASENEYEVGYNELVHGRTSDVKGGVEWICPSKGDEGEDDLGEFELIARKIQSIILGGDPKYQVEDKEGLRLPRYDDIAILLRTRTPLPLIERELRALNIPFVVAKGAGFFLQQEILDAVSYLSFLIAPYDDLSLVAILRSPFFVLSDVDLFQISAHTGERSLSFWERLQEYAAFANRETLTRAVVQLSGNLAISGRTSASFLLGKIFEETGIYATLSARADGRQKIANLDKLLGMSRASDVSGFQSLFDFVERVRYLIEEDEKESQADSVKTCDAVQIMTVHAAKGLEFPIVVLPQLQRTFQYDKSGMLEPELGMHIRIPEAEHQPFIAEYLRERSHARTDAEEKRILYVAMTRAKDHLILSSTLPKKQLSTNWLAWISNAFPSVFDIEVSSIPIDESIRRYNGTTQRTSDERVAFTIPFIRIAEDISRITDATVNANVPVFTPLHLGPLASSVNTQKYSFTKLSRYYDCATKYYLGVTLNLKLDNTLDREPDDSDYEDRWLQSSTLRASDFGTIVHDVFSKVDSIVVDGHINDTILEQAIISALSKRQKVVIEPQFSELKQNCLHHIQTFVQSEYGVYVLSCKNCFIELNLQTTTSDGSIVEGVIDRLFQDKNGEWKILDYKTGNEGHYELQMRFYAFLLNRLYPGQQTIKTTLFYTQSGDIKEYQHGVNDFQQFEKEALEVIRKINVDAKTSQLLLLDRNLSHCHQCQFADESGTCIVLKADAHAREITQLA